MVILGGLEVVAAGYLLNEFNKDKIEARERRKRDKNHDDDRPHSRPPHGDSQNHRPSANQLAPPFQPPRPSSAPPNNVAFNGPGPQGPWSQPVPPQGNIRPPAHPGTPQQPPGSPYPFQTHLQSINRPQSQSPYPQGPPPPYAMGSSHQGPPPTGPQRHGPPPPGPGHLQHANTFYAQQSPPMFQPSVPQSQTFPIHGQSQRPFAAPIANVTSQQSQGVKPPPQGPLVYIDSKTGKVQHNMYPPDHPMARGLQDDGNRSYTDFSRDQKYARALPGDLNTGLIWSDRDEDDLAYGKDYTSKRYGDRYRG